jgi:AcrR family transcriptional regulator
MMEASNVTEARPGLRERKKQETRDTIARVALQLFVERGYEQTTLADIAEAANVSKRTIFAYYESKEDILFCDEPEFYAQLKRALEERPAEETTIDALRAFFGALAAIDETGRLRKQIIASDESLRHSERARSGRFEELLVQSIAKDLGTDTNDIRPNLVAASMTAAFTNVRDRFEAETGGPIDHDQAMAILDEVLDFIRGGLDTMRR